MLPLAPPSRPSPLRGVLALGLFLALTATNPWGVGHEEIWNAPREWGMTLFTVATLIGVASKKGSLQPTRRVLGGLLASAGFLVVGILSTLLSPQPIWSWTGYPSVGDGLRFWALGVAFAWAVYLALESGLLTFRLVQASLLAALALHALAIFPQAWDWKLDYTRTSGQTFVRCFDEARTICREVPDATASGIHRGQMPIGLTSHRGHAGGVLALLSLFAAGAYFLRASRWQLGVFALGALALWFTVTRGAWLALWVPLGFLVLYGFRRSPGHAKRGLALLSVGMVTYSLYFGATKVGLGEVRSFPEMGASFSEANAYSSGRLELWSKGFAALSLRPLWGWGFDGFARAYPYAVDWNQADRRLLPPPLEPPVHVVQGEDRLIYLEDAQGTRLLAPSPYAKAHNLPLDLLLSVGILGGLSYLLWLGLALACATWSKVPLALMLVGYMLYGLTWYDSVHVTPLALMATGALFAREEAWIKG